MMIIVYIIIAGLTMTVIAALYVSWVLLKRYGNNANALLSVSEKDIEKVYRDDRLFRMLITPVEVVTTLLDVAESLPYHLSSIWHLTTHQQVRKRYYRRRQYKRGQKYVAR